jgi:hypothetical protein
LGHIGLSGWLRLWAQRLLDHRAQHRFIHAPAVNPIRSENENGLNSSVGILNIERDLSLATLS